MIKAFFILILLAVSACSDDDSFSVESAHVEIHGKLKPESKVSASEAKSAIQVVVDGLEKK